MKERFADLIYDARRLAGLTIPKAAEQLDISPRALQYYESDHTVPDKIVARMVQVYGNPIVGYSYLSNELDTGKILLPRLSSTGVASKSLRLRVAINHVKALQQELDKICMDDLLDEAELKTLAGTVGKYAELAGACINIQMMAGFYAKEKDVPAATRTSSARA